MPCVINGTNRYSTAGFVAELVREYFILEARREKTRLPDILKETSEYCFIACCK
jgi:hypothetical protein